MHWLIPLLVFLGSLQLTGLMHRYALRRGLMDIPNARSSHLVPTPRGGGLAFVSSLMLAVLGSYLMGGWASLGGRELALALWGGGLLIALLGFWDDHGHIPARWRLAGHLLVAGGALVLLGVPGSLGLPEWLAYPLFLIGIVWLLNLFNFMDGIDGIAGSEALSVTGGAMLLIGWLGMDSVLSDWLGVAAAATAGFLLWNWPPAKIFMGDVGSGFLGYLLAIFALQSANIGLLPIWSWLILLGVFIVDATLTLARRFLAGEAWYSAHRSHAYQILSRRWRSHRRATLGVLVINLVWLLPLAALAAARPALGVVLTLLAYLPLILLGLKIGAGRPESNG
ncbi:MraY family glycosyltransferase [Candidatus Endoriftia persephonae]|jgi:Fuc2NAc and GlcNAc transferase|uniref:Glycosyl transferase, group 4 family protein n=2 Tax=Gammaproteobacteria TaxID=1236 RepID=G2FH54_9GAMM|nr:glycosyltransferase family 4 protein [Candidatus Endoriftia persephone]EGW53868.1 glycosyl transferase, group 4 family protein [endosymbiont of Tevnia jerichonana (vent Tica)]USF87717.1 glycosyltransferase family 4 protein [Candidatus Endoriftia persephone]